MAMPTADDPVAVIRDSDAKPLLCVAYEPEPHVAFAQTGIDAVGNEILKYINPFDNCFVLFHMGSEYDPGRHEAQARIFEGYYLY